MSIDRKGGVTRYAVTHVNKDGMRGLTFANQGRNHFDTREAAEQYIAAMKKNNPAKLITDMYRDSLEVRPVECYWHGDAKGVWFD